LPAGQGTRSAHFAVQAADAVLEGLPGVAAVLA
jgi:hypothetical protein